MGFGLYQNRGDIRRALDTGAKPNFVLSALVHQGMNRDEAYRMVNEILQELSSVKHSRQNYLDDMISSFDRDEDGDFGWWERDSRRPKSRARPPRSARREGSEFESIPVESDKMYKKGFDSSYPEDGDDSDLTGDDDDFDIFEDDSDSAEDQKDPSKKSGLDIDDDISISLPNQDETDSDDFDDDSVEVDWLDVDLKKRKKR